MLFFRSEELLNQWLAARQAEPGAVLSIPTLWQLSQLWYHNRLSIEYHGRDADQVRNIFEQVGLTSEFWQIG